MKIIITHKPTNYSKPDLDLYNPRCPICGELRDHGGLTLQDTLFRQGRNLGKIPGIEEETAISILPFSFNRYRKFKCHTCGCEWKVRK